MERTIGIWKRRFPCLSLGMRTKLQTTAAVIVATAVLHNMAKRDDLPDELHEQLPDVDYDHAVHNNDAEENAVRMEIINTFFN